MRLRIVVFFACGVAVCAVGVAAPPTRAQYIVKLKAGASLKDSEIAALGGAVDFKTFDRIVLTLPEPAVAALRAHASTKYIQRVVLGPRPVVTPAAVPESTVAALHSEVLRPTPDFTNPPTWSSGPYAYDGVGNVVGIGTDSYTYDSLSRLQQSTVRGHNETYTYDAYGNMTQKVTDGLTRPISIDSNTNHVTTSTYDAAGSVITDALQTYDHDPFGQMREKDYSGNQDSYVYTADDERIGVRTGSSFTWTWSFRDFSGNVIRQYQSSDAQRTMPWLWIEDYVYRDGLLLGAERVTEEGGRRHFHLDHLGTPRLITGSSGQRISEHDYFPFGNEIPPLCQESCNGFDREDPMKFTGHERDFMAGTSMENTNYFNYMHARYNDSNSARFLSVDPIGGNPYRPQTWNRYEYVLNNPIKYVDSRGLSPCTITGSDGKPHPGECIDVIGKNPRDYLPGSYPGQLPPDSFPGRYMQLLDQANRGNEFAMMQLGYPARRFGIQATHAEFLLIAPLTGLLRQIGMAGGELGLKAATEGAATEGGSFFDGATFNLAKTDAFHEFPESVMAFEDAGTATTITGADGATYQMLRIPGGYLGKEGVFEFIKNNQNEIVHYFFNPIP